MTAKGGANSANGPDCQTAQAEPDLTRADQPSEAAQTANALARPWELAGRNRQAGDGRCPARGARQAQTEPRTCRRQTTRPLKRAGTEKKRVEAAGNMT